MKKISVISIMGTYSHFRMREIHVGEQLEIMLISDLFKRIGFGIFLQSVTRSLWMEDNHRLGPCSLL